MRRTFDNLFKLKAIPIVNENDSTATTEIKYGDNDRLAARVAQIIGADELVIFSDVDGLYDKSKQKKIVKEIQNMYQGKQSKEIEKILRYLSKTEIIHKDDMVLL